MLTNEPTNKYDWSQQYGQCFWVRQAVEGEDDYLMFAITQYRITQ